MLKRLLFLMLIASLILGMSFVVVGTARADDDACRGRTGELATNNPEECGHHKPIRSCKNNPYGHECRGGGPFEPRATITLALAAVVAGAERY